MDGDGRIGASKFIPALCHGVDSCCFEGCRLLGCDAAWLFIITDVSEERISSIIKTERISELGTVSELVPFTLKIEAIRSSETSCSHKNHSA
jgi:hypothetical protein